MKNSIIFTTIIAVALSSQLVFAGSIANPSATGDTLTATKMNEIRDAVNDNDGKITINTSIINENTLDIGNKQDLVTGTCPTGQAIRVINADGTVTCQQRSVITVITMSADIATGSFGCAVSDCPPSHPIAIGGGVDPNNVLSMQITGSNPIISNEDRVITLPEGENPAPTGWHACAVNNSASAQPIATIAICSDQ